MKIKIKLVSLIVLICMLSGCVSVFRNQREEELNKKIVQLQESILTKEARIGQLESLLMDRGSQLSEKDSKIEELRSKLEMFGVFEK